MEARKREFDAKRRAANRQKGANLLGMASNPGALLRGAADIPGSVYRYLRDNEPVEIGEDVSNLASSMAADFRKDPVKFAVDMVNPVTSVQDFADIRAQARDLRAAGDLDTAAMLEQVAAMSPLAVVPVVGKVLSKSAKIAAKKAAKKTASLAVKPAEAAAEKAPLAVKPLAMDETSRMARADRLFPVSAYHGSPRDIKKFSNRYGSPEGHYGANHYFTTSLDDVNQNYAGEGPDLTGRIERVLERDADGGDDYHLRELAQERGLDFDNLSHGEVEQLARDSARAALGIENQGTVYPVRLRMEKPVVVGGKGETYWPYKYETDEAGDFIGESGEALDLLRHTREAMDDWNVDPRTVDRVAGQLLPDDGGVSAGRFEGVLRSNIHDLYDDMTGDSASPGALLADIYQRMGYDSVNMDASIFGARVGAMGGKIPGMVGVNDARHYVVFDPKRIRSRFAAFDPDKLDSDDLGHAHGGRVSSLAVKRKGKK